MLNVEDKITSTIARSIHKFVKEYNESVENIQIVFKLDSGGTLMFFTCVKQELKHTVKLEYLIGNNIYNLLIKKHIKKLLQKFASQMNLQDQEVNIMTGIKAQNHVYVWLRKGNELIRQLEADELK